jgi:hypothetical protein
MELIRLKLNKKSYICRRYVAFILTNHVEPHTKTNNSTIIANCFSISTNCRMRKRKRNRESVVSGKKNQCDRLVSIYNDVSERYA